MASNQKIIYVYESFKSTTPNFLGTLFVENVRGRESYSIAYDADWLKSSANYMYLDPDLQLYAGRQYPTGAKNVFGLFADSSPDRWGRLLMTRRERILAITGYLSVSSSILFCSLWYSASCFFR